MWDKLPIFRTKSLSLANVEHAEAIYDQICADCAQQSIPVKRLITTDGLIGGFCRWEWNVMYGDGRPMRAQDLALEFTLPPLTSDLAYLVWLHEFGHYYDSEVIALRDKSMANGLAGPQVWEDAYQGLYKLALETNAWAWALEHSLLKPNKEIKSWLRYSFRQCMTPSIPQAHKFRTFADQIEYSLA